MTDIGLENGEDCRGQSFTAEGKLVGVTVGYASYDPSLRAGVCRIFMAQLHSENEFNSQANLVAESIGWEDGQAFGSGGFSRTYNFDRRVYLQPGIQYFAYFSEAQPLLQSIGDGFIDFEFEEVEGVSAMFDVETS